MRRCLITSAIFSFCALFVGCGNESFAPPVKASRNASSTSANLPQRAREIAFILPEDVNDDLNAMEVAARLEIGERHAVYNLFRPNPGDPPAKQADLIREAAKGNTSAIIVIPNKSKETAEALASVDQKKTPIILLARATSANPSSAFPLISWPAFGTSAKLIVAGVVADVKKAGMPDDAPILLLKSDPADETSVARDEALTAAIKATSHPLVGVVSMTDENVSRVALQNALKANPKVCAMIADDTLGITVASSLRADQKPPGIFVIGGYCLSSKNVTMITLKQNSVLVERARDAIVRKAVNAAIDRIEGRSVPDRIEIELPVRGSTSGDPELKAALPPIVFPTVPDLLQGKQP